jgi:hypothetical protein
MFFPRRSAAFGWDWKCSYKLISLVGVVNEMLSAEFGPGVLQTQSDGGMGNARNHK